MLLEFWDIMIGLDRNESVWWSWWD